MAIRRFLFNIRAWIREIRNAIQDQSETDYISGEEQRNKQFPPDKIRTIVSFDDETIRRTQAEENRKQTTQESIKTAAWCTFGAATIYASVSLLMWCQMIKQTGISQRQLESIDRPWIKVSLSANAEWTPGALIGGPLTFDADGTGHLTTKFTLANIGHSVATNISIRDKIIPHGLLAEEMKLPLSEQREFCSQPRNRQTAAAYAIFPGDTHVDLELGTFDTARLADTAGLKNGKPMNLFVIGCADYTYGSSDRDHQTGFIYEVWGGREHRGIQNKMTIAVGDLTFEPFFLGGDYAY